MLSHLRTDNKQFDLLLAGYIRQNYGNGFISDVSKKCADFYDDIFYSNIDYPQNSNSKAKDKVNIRGI